MKKIYLLIAGLSGWFIQAQSLAEISAGLPQLQNSIIAWGDYDGDQDLDVYISGRNANNTIEGALYENNNGQFTLVANTGLPSLEFGEAQWEDMNGDGYVDLVITGYDDNAGVTNVYFNNNDGTFSASSGFLPMYLGGLDVADIDGDNDLDFIVTGMETNNWTWVTKIYVNDGNGNFSENNAVTFPPLEMGKIRFADYDNDGDQDFVLNGFDDGAATYYTKIWQNDGSGNFTETNITLYQAWLGDMVWLDVDHDNDLDLIISGTGGDGTERVTALYLNDGNGGFQFASNVTFPGLSLSNIEVADFNNDGNLDVFMTGDTGSSGSDAYAASVFLGDGQGGFSLDANIHVEPVVYGDAKVADFDGDGDTDLLVSGYNSSDVPYTGLYENRPAVAVEKTELVIFSVYPNPASGKVYVHLKNFYGKHEQLILQDLNGRIYKRIPLYDNQPVLDVEGLKRGVYLLRTGRYAVRLIVR